MTFPNHKWANFRNSVNTNSVPVRQWKNYIEHFGEITARLQAVVIENSPAIQVIEEYDTPETLHFVDPPYLHETRGRVRGYRHEMTDGDHVNLAHVLHELSGNVIISGYPSQLYEDLYRDWTRVDRKAYADGARARTECLWIKNYSGGLF